jgi:hypothetical protein
MAVAKIRPLFISDFDGAVIRPENETNKVLLRMADPKVSVLRKALLEERHANIELLRPSGLLRLAPQAGFYVVRKEQSYFVKRVPGQHDRALLSLAAMPPGQIAGQMKHYFGRGGPTVSEFFACLLPADSDFDMLFTGAKDVEDVHDRQMLRMLNGEVSQVQFHRFLDTVYKSFLTRTHVEAASRAIAEGFVRPGMANALSEVRKAGGHIVFCSYSYVQILEGVLHDMMHRMGMRNGHTIQCVANSIRFDDGKMGEHIVAIDRIGDKWAALDAILRAQGFPKQGGRYSHSLVYDDSEYNLPDMARLFSIPILLVPNGNSRQPGAAARYASYMEKYPSLRLCAETDVSGVNILRGIIADEFKKFHIKP